MKFSNCKIGVEVVVKKSNTTFGEDREGEAGIITGVDARYLDGNTVRVNFSDRFDDSDWGNHEDLKMIKEDSNNTVLG